MLKLFYTYVYKLQINRFEVNKYYSITIVSVICNNINDNEIYCKVLVFIQKYI